MPQDFSELVEPNSTAELVLRDNLTEDGDPKALFSNLTISRGTELSDFDFWESEQLTETRSGDIIEYTLLVDSTFFK